MEENKKECTCPSWIKHSKNIPCTTKQELEENSEKVLNKFKEQINGNRN